MNWKGETFKPNPALETSTGGSNFDTFGTAMVATSLIQAGAGIFAYGAAKNTAKANNAVAEANGEIQKTGIMKQYTELLKKETDMVGTQKAIFAGANHSWKDSVYQEAMFDSEENFLSNKKQQEKDLASVDRQVTISKSGNNSAMHGLQGAAITGTASNLLGNYTNYKLWGGGK